MTKETTLLGFICRSTKSEMSVRVSLKELKHLQIRKWIIVLKSCRGKEIYIIKILKSFMLLIIQLHESFNCVKLLALKPHNSSYTKAFKKIFKIIKLTTTFSFKALIQIFHVKHFILICHVIINIICNFMKVIIRLLFLNFLLIMIGKNSSHIIRT